MGEHLIPPVDTTSNIVAILYTVLLMNFKFIATYYFIWDCESEEIHWYK